VYSGGSPKGDPDRAVLIAFVLPALLLLLCWSFHGRGWPIVLIGIGMVAAGVYYFFRGG